MQAWTFLPPSSTVGTKSLIARHSSWIVWTPVFSFVVRGTARLSACCVKVGLGDCTKDVWEDPVKPLEDALRSVWDSTAEVFGAAWDSTSEVVGAVTDTVASDMRQVSESQTPPPRAVGDNRPRAPLEVEHGFVLLYKL